MAPKSQLKLVAPTSENRAVGLSRRPNSEFRSREHLTPTEVQVLIDAAKTNRYGLRDATMILVAYRHGFRAAEICPRMVRDRLQCRDHAGKTPQERKAFDPSDTAATSCASCVSFARNRSLSQLSYS